MASTIDKDNQKETPKTVTDEPPAIGVDSPMKRSAPSERPKPQKKAKASKMDNRVTTLTEGDLTDMENTIRDATRVVVNEVMSEQQIVLGELHTQLHELGSRIAQVGTSATPGVSIMAAMELLLKAQMVHSIPIPTGALITT